MGLARISCLTLCLLAFSVSADAAVAVPEASEKAMSYYYTRNALWAIGLALGLLVPALILFTGWSARIRDVARRVSSKWAVTLLVYLVIYSAVTFVLGAPFAYYEEFVVEHQFGLSNQALSKWIGDSLIGFGVSIVIGYLILLGIYRMLKRSPQRWWFYTGLISVPFVCLLILVAPIWIDPLFNKFGPMKDRVLEAKILALADKAGIEGGRVFEVEKSVDTKKISAYVSGFMDTKRIVLWDNIIARLDERELMSVMGHEMGHYVLGHVWKLILFICALIMLALYAAHRLSRRLIDRYKERFGFDRLDDVASWPLINLVASVVIFIAAPVFNAYSRYNEHEADRFGLEITRNNDAAAQAFVKLQADNLGNPRPNALLHLLRGDHPTLAERIEFANDYKPWEKGEPLKYGEFFRK
jgi:STE24 endopeptidase